MCSYFFYTGKLEVITSFFSLKLGWAGSELISVEKGYYHKIIFVNNFKFDQRFSLCA